MGLDRIRIIAADITAMDVDAIVNAANESLRPGGGNNEDGLLAQCYRRSLGLVLGNNLKTVAFPAISTGVYRFPMSCAAHIAISTASAFLTGDDRIEQVTFCCFGEASVKAHEKALSVLGE